MEPQIEVVHHKNSRRQNSVNGDLEPYDHESCFSKKVTFWHQFRALFMKDLSLQLKSYVTNICQLLVPVIFICFAGIIQVVLNHFLHKNGSQVPGSNSLLLPYDVSRVINCNVSSVSSLDDQMPGTCYDEVFNFLTSFDVEALPALLLDEEVPQLPNVTFAELIEVLMVNSTIPTQQVLFDLPYYYFGKNPSVNLDAQFEELLVATPLLFNFSLNFTINPRYKDRFFDEDLKESGNYVQIPFFLSFPNGSITDLQRHLVQVVTNYNDLAGTSAAGNDQYNRNYEVNAQSQEQYNATLKNVQERDFSNVKPQGAIYFNSFSESGSPVNIDYTIIANEISLYVVRDFSFKDQLGSSSSSLEVQRRNTLMNMAHNAILKHILDDSDYYNESLISTYIMPLFPHEANLTIDVTNLLGGILYPFAASFLFPVFIAALVKDKFERHLIMMEQNGLNRLTYWTITYIFNYIIYIIIAIVIAICSLLWKVRLFTQTNPLLNFIVFVLWGHSQVVLGFFFSNFFNRPRTATIVGYILVIAGVMVAMVLELLQVFPDNKTPFFVYMMYPPFAFYRLLFYMIDACGSYQCYGIEILSPKGGLNLVTTAILYLAGSTVLLLFVSLYLSYVLPTEYGVRKSPFFPLIALYKSFLWVLRKFGFRQKCNSKELQTPTTPRRRNNVSIGIVNDSIDDEVLQEETLVVNEYNILDAPVIISRLRKEYSGSGGKPPHVAVESFSLVVNRNECFGLLGPNGAGKTTLISVLTGLYEPSSGSAKVAGYDLATQMSDIHHHLGVCPQFDIQYPELTAEEHLLFYARLKGVKIGKATAVVKRALKQVNLYEARGRRSKALSGGMRRRLSVAMSCVGNPDILILDEPTTGLDPASRRQVWEVIERVKDGRSVILTTHAMEEADHLCTRIGIMNYGRLRCLGSQTRLKAKFGEGYQLKFHCRSGRIREVERYVQANVPSARHMETYADSCTYQIDKEDVVVSELFALFNNVKDEIGIVDWGIKMTTLEDVFLNIVKTHTDTRNESSYSTCPAWFPCQCCYKSRTGVQ